MPLRGVARKVAHAAKDIGCMAGVCAEGETRTLAQHAAHVSKEPIDTRASRLPGLVRLVVFNRLTRVGILWEESSICINRAVGVRVISNDVFDQLPDWVDTAITRYFSLH